MARRLTLQWLLFVPYRALAAVRSMIRSRQPAQDFDLHRDLAVNWLLTAHAVGCFCQAKIRPFVSRKQGHFERLA